MDERLEKAIAGNEKLAKLVSEAEKMGIKIVVADDNEELPNTLEFAMARTIEHKIPTVISPSGSAYPSGQENRRKRREMERKNKKGKK